MLPLIQTKAGFFRLSDITSIVLQQCSRYSTTNRGQKPRRSLNFPPIDKRHKDCSLITGITITPTHVVWAVLNRKKNVITDCGSCGLSTNGVRQSFPVTAFLAHHVKSKIPASDLYVMEDPPLAGVNQPTVISKNLLILDSMLTALLSTFDMEEETPFHRVIHFKSSSVGKRYGLTIGNERTSSQHIIRQMIRSSKVLGKELGECYIDSEEGNPTWVHCLDWPDSQMARQILQGGDVWKENVSNAILLTTAFNDLCLEG